MMASQTRAPSGSPAARTHERMLFRRFATTRDAGTREAIVKRHMGLAHSVAMRFSRSSIPHDDRVQIACLGLLKAIDRFDPDRGVAFSSFAVPTMVGELQRHIRDHTWAVRPPREMQERLQRIERTAGSLDAALGRPATVAELSRATGLSSEEVLDTLEAARARDFTSLDQPAGAEAESPLAATIGHEDARYRHAENKVLADGLLSELAPRQQQILRLRFELDLTQSEIGKLVGCSQMQVSRVLRDSLDQLAASAGPDRMAVLGAV